MAVLETSGAAPAQVPSVSLAARRALFAALVTVSMAALLWLMGSALSVGGIGALDVIILILFAMTLPWLVIGFWNAAIVSPTRVRNRMRRSVSATGAAASTAC